MINFDALDFSECLSEEVILKFLLTLSVHDYTFDQEFEYFFYIQGADMIHIDTWYT